MKKILLTLLMLLAFIVCVSSQSPSRGLVAVQDTGQDMQPKIHVKTNRWAVYPLAFSSNADLMLFLMDDYEICLVNVQLGLELRCFMKTSHFDIGESMAVFSQDSEYVKICIKDEAYIFNVRTGIQETGKDDLLWDTKNICSRDNKGSYNDKDNYPEAIKKVEEDWASEKLVFVNEKSTKYLAVDSIYEGNCTLVDVVEKREIFFNFHPLASNKHHQEHQGYIYGYIYEKEYYPCSIVVCNGTSIVRYSMLGEVQNVYLKEYSDIVIDVMQKEQNLVVFFSKSIVIFNIESGKLIKHYNLENIEIYSRCRGYLDINIEKEYFVYIDGYTADVSELYKYNLLTKTAYYFSDTIFYHDTYCYLNGKSRYSEKIRHLLKNGLTVFFSRDKNSVFIFDMDSMSSVYDFALDFDLKELCHKHDYDEQSFFYSVDKIDDSKFAVNLLDYSRRKTFLSIVINLDDGSYTVLRKENGEILEPYSFIYINGELILLSDGQKLSLYNFKTRTVINSLENLPDKWMWDYNPDKKTFCIQSYNSIDILDMNFKLIRRCSDCKELISAGFRTYITHISPRGCEVYDPLVKYGAVQENTYSFVFAGTESLTYTPEGFFSGTEWACKNLVYLVDGLDVIKLDQIYDKLYRPDLVAAKARGEDISAETANVNLASLLSNGKAPTVAFRGVPKISDTRDLTFDFTVTDSGGGIGAVSIVLNDKVIKLKDGIHSSKGETKVIRHTVTLQDGENKIQAFACNSAGVIESLRAETSVTWHGKTLKPNLYVLTMAVNKYHDKDLWLNYAVPDAISIADGFMNQKHGLYENVFVHSLQDSQVTKTGIAEKFKELSVKITADDVFLLYFSGHGTTYEGDYYFIPVDFMYTNRDDIPISGISKNDLVENLSHIKALKTLVILDTCNSGSFLSTPSVRGMNEKYAIDRLTHATGHATLAASSDSQSAMEGYNGHGIFTFELLEGLSGKADFDNDGYISLTELSLYLENEVPKRCYEKWGYKQVPQKKLPMQDFPLAETK